MAEKVAKLGVQREKDQMYYIKFDNSGGAVMGVPRKQPGQPKGKPSRVAQFDGARDNAYIYFLDKDGDVARAKRAIGGQKRKKAGAKAAKKATKKPAKKAAAKKPAKKAAAKKKPAKKGKKR
jgi:DNA-binding protein HU-beta